MAVRKLIYIFYQVKLTGLSVQEEVPSTFQDGGHVGFSMETVLAIFDLHVGPLIPIRFPVNWPFGSGEEV